ncbi:MAG: hypothetical protein K2N87_11970 [Eubacterium sp.]|nr:hypothetical protein [Eubacterium sp.]
MSRSFKKTPIVKCAGSGVYGKKLANRKVRHMQNDMLVNRKAYRKLYETWNIYDCKTHMTRQDAKSSGMMDVWEKFYYRK